MRYKIDLAGLLLERNLCYCAVFALFFWYLRAISKYKPPLAYIRRGDLVEGFLCYEYDGHIFGGAYFRNFTVDDFSLIPLL